MPTDYTMQDNTIDRIVYDNTNQTLNLNNTREKQ